MMPGWSSTPSDLTPAPTATPGGPVTVSYSQDVQPILDRECVRCHGGRSGLFMDSYDNLMDGNIIVPGDPEASELVMSIQESSQSIMPPGSDGLSASEIDLIVTWIAEGCPNN